MKGFALMLLIGTVDLARRPPSPRRARCSGLLAGFRWFDNPRFMGATAQRDPEVAALGRRRAPPAVVHPLARRDRRRASSRSLVQGLNLGIDFKGGVQVTFTTPKAVAISTGARPDGGDRPRRRDRPGPRQRRPTATSTRASRSASRSSTRPSRTQLTNDARRAALSAGQARGEERLVELQPADPAAARSSRSSSRSR